MNPVHDIDTEDGDPRLVRAVQDYLAELEAGRRPDRAAFLARSPDLAPALGPYLDAVDIVHAAAPLSNSPSASRPVQADPLVEPLGDFRIVREIGHGGMGVVYEAVQMSLGRRVALKVLPFAAALDARQLQRFKNEAQAAAQLHHTNIVPVYAVGCDRGVHYYAMQLIDGKNLAAVIGELRPGEVTKSEPGGIAVEPVRQPAPVATSTALAGRLTTERSRRSADFFRTVVRLAAQAAEGLDYAHGMGIVHRDVKPANLLVDDRGNVWITDFGLASFHADAGLTQTGDLLGTLRYMSPEQAGGQRVLLDHRTDVYSLGATLYEMLTLQPIFEGADRQTLLNRILHDEPRPPRAIDRAVPEELETIVLKAVAKLPGERYSTAREFADDLNRFLRNEPILARRATPVQRVRKWLRRHPSVTVASLILLVLLTAGSVVAAWLIRGEQEKTRAANDRLRGEQEKTQTANEKLQLAVMRERRRAEQAEQRFRLAVDSSDDMIRVAEELADNPQLEGVRVYLLEVALENYQEFIEQRRDDPAAQSLLERTRDHVKTILRDLAALRMAGQLSLLGVPSVLDDLKLEADKRDRVTELKKQADQLRNGIDKLPPKQRRERFLEMAHTIETDIAGMLNGTQLARLQQVSLQAQGPMALREPRIAAMLKLTADQKEQIRAIEWDMFSGMFEFGKSGGPRGGPPDRGGPDRGGPDRGRPGPPHPWTSDGYEKALRAAMEKIAMVLDENQARQWKEMTGEPFKGRFMLRPPGFGPRDGGPPK